MTDFVGRRAVDEEWRLQEDEAVMEDELDQFEGVDGRLLLYTDDSFADVISFFRQLDDF